MVSGNTHRIGSNSQESEHLSPDRRRLVVLLGLPALGLALASTVVTTYLPVFIAGVSGPVMTGVLIGAEGGVALFAPVLIGSWSDRVKRQGGSRLPFLLVAAPPLLLVLVAMPIAGSLAALAPLVILFYLGYFAYYAPYRALYPDLVGSDERGRSQGIQKTLREVGLVSALVGGGLLLALWRPLPFVLAGVVLIAVTIGLVHGLRRRGTSDAGAEETGEEEPSGEREDSDSGSSGPAPREAFRQLRELIADPRIRWLAIANALWEAALGAIKAFVVLFFTIGLGRSTSFASGVLAIAAVAIIAAALIGGTLADRIGERRLMAIAIPVYGIGLLGPLISQSPIVIATVPPVAFAGGIVMTLAYALLMGLMPERHHGSSAGLFEFSRGVGALSGPLFAGLAVAACSGLLASTDGYAAMWAVASLAILLSLPALRRSQAFVDGAEADPEGQQSPGGREPSPQEAGGNGRSSRTPSDEAAKAGRS